MGQSYHALWVHLVWGTKYRQPTITKELKFRLFSKLREIAKEKGYHLDFINGVEDHVHLLVALHPSCSIAEVVKNLKGISHIWVRDTQLSDQYFHWQDGYAAISVSPGRVSIVRNYIRNQEQRHSRQSFKKEWAELRKHAIEIRNDGF